MVRKYKVLHDRVLRGSKEASAGDIVYDCMGHDYGCASDDTRILGYEHMSVTKDPKGGYPFFTIPVSHLAEIK